MATASAAAQHTTGIWITRIDWGEEKVCIDLSKDAVKNSPEYPSAPAVTQELEHRLYAYCNRTGYWV